MSNYSHLLVTTRKQTKVTSAATKAPINPNYFIKMFSFSPAICQKMSEVADDLGFKMMDDEGPVGNIKVNHMLT